MLFKIQNLEFSWKNSQLLCITEPQGHTIVETSSGEKNKYRIGHKEEKKGLWLTSLPVASCRTLLLRLGRKGHLSSLKPHSNISAAIWSQYREMWTYHSTINVGEYYRKGSERNRRDVESREEWSPEMWSPNNQSRLSLGWSHGRNDKQYNWQVSQVLTVKRKDRSSMVMHWKWQLNPGWTKTGSCYDLNTVWCHTLLSCHSPGPGPFWTHLTVTGVMSILGHL